MIKSEYRDILQMVRFRHIDSNGQTAERHGDFTMNIGNTLEEIREFFQNDHFATENGAVIEAVEDGMARCSMKLTSHHLNAAGNIMGGAIFTLADFTAAVAANWQGTLHVSRTSQITFLGTAKGGQLIATARRIKEGHRTSYYLVEVTDEVGTQIAHVTSDGFTMP